MPLSLASFFRHSISSYDPNDATGSVTTSTGSIADEAIENLDLEISSSFLVSRIILSHSARVIIYSSAAARTADLGRDNQTAPAPDAGVVFDVTFTTDLDIPITPASTFLNLDSPRTSVAYLSVQNLSGGNANISLTLEFLLIRELDQRIISVKGDTLLKASQEYVVRSATPELKTPVGPVEGTWFKVENLTGSSLTFDSRFKIASTSAAGSLWGFFESSNWNLIDRAGTQVISLPTIAPARLATKDPITFTSTALGSYTYTNGNDLTFINNDDTTEGVMVADSLELLFFVKFNDYFYLNEIQVWNGQISGAFNTANTLQVYSGRDDSGTLLFSVSLVEDTNQQTFALESDSSFDSFIRYLTFKFTNTDSADGKVSINELKLLGNN